MNEKQRLFVDMDGTLAVFQPVEQLETLYEKGYFEQLKPIRSVLDAVKSIIKEHQEVDVYVLSAYLSDSPYALTEKNQWLDRYLPELPAEKRVFLPCGADKKEYIPDGVRTSDVLLDDYTQNLQLWHPPARGIKLLNGINHTRGTWQHDRISYNKPSAALMQDILKVIQGEVVRDCSPQKYERQEPKRREGEKQPDIQRMSLTELTEAVRSQDSIPEKPRERSNSELQR